ncbi:MAG: SDR family NAD(P)-dependent oxidoreductase [Gammaproteobacteria bacterium]|jgi:benzil reductase ((S)-benzoin forming)
MKLAIITGGSKGLGAELVKQYAQQDFEVIEFSRSGNTPYSKNVDLSNLTVANQVIAETLETLSQRQYSEIIAVSNAALLTPIGPLTDSDASDWVTNINASFTSAILFMGSFVKYFQTHDCPKVMASISSGAALNAYHGWSLYCAGKAGLEHYIRCIAEEQIEQTHPVVPININPGVIDTDMQTAIRGTSEQQFPQRERFVELKNSDSLQQPAAVATAIRSILAGDLNAGERYSVAS